MTKRKQRNGQMPTSVVAMPFIIVLGKQLDLFEFQSSKGDIVSHNYRRPRTSYSKYCMDKGEHYSLLGEYQLEQPL